MFASRQVACRCIILAGGSTVIDIGSFLSCTLFYYSVFFFSFLVWCGGCLSAVSLTPSIFPLSFPRQPPSRHRTSVRPLCLCPCGWAATPCLSSSWSRFFLLYWLGGDASNGQETFFPFPPCVAPRPGLSPPSAPPCPTIGLFRH